MVCCTGAHDSFFDENVFVFIRHHYRVRAPKKRPIDPKIGCGIECVRRPRMRVLLNYLVESKHTCVRKMKEYHI